MCLRLSSSFGSLGRRIHSVRGDFDLSGSEIDFIFVYNLLLTFSSSFKGFHVGDAVKFFLTHTSTLLTASKNGLDYFLMPTNWASG